MRMNSSGTLSTVTERRDSEYMTVQVALQVLDDLLERHRLKHTVCGCCGLQEQKKRDEDFVCSRCGSAECAEEK